MSSGVVPTVRTGPSPAGLPGASGVSPGVVVLVGRVSGVPSLTVDGSPARPVLSSFGFSTVCCGEGCSCARPAGCSCGSLPVLTGSVGRFVGVSG
jgi:hypothetical protein